MRNKFIATVVLSAFVLTCSETFAAANFNYQSNTPVYQNQQTQYSPYPVPSYSTQNYSSSEPLRGSVVMVPAGTTFGANTTSSLSSETATLGQNVSWVLSSDFYYGGKLIACSGSVLNGTVTVAKKAGRTGKNGQLAVKFTNIMTPTGQMIPLSAHIQTNDGTGILTTATAKDTAKEYAKDIGIGAAGGAVLGTALGALSGGSVGQGAIYGTALGGGLGLGKSLIDKGSAVEIPANSQILIQLDQPVTVNSNTNF